MFSNFLACSNTTFTSKGFEITMSYANDSANFAAPEYAVITITLVLGLIVLVPIAT